MLNSGLALARRLKFIWALTARGTLALNEVCVPGASILKAIQFLSSLIDLSIGFFCVLATALVLHVFHLDSARALFLLTLLLMLSSVLRGAFSNTPPLLRETALALAPATVLAAAFLSSAQSLLSQLFFILLVAIFTACLLGGSCGLYFKQRKFAQASAWLALVLLYLAFFSFKLLPGAVQSAKQKQMDQPAPAFAVTTLEGAAYNNSSLLGKVVVIDFWGTWCPPCVHELPELNSIYLEYKDDPRVQFLAIEAPNDGESADSVRQYLRTRNIALPSVFDTGSAQIAFRVSFFPTLIILDPRGHIRMIDSGLSTEHALHALIDSRISTLKSIQ